MAQDYTRWSLPDNAKARLGKGNIHEIVYSPDGTRLVVGSSIGVWIYDTQSGYELALLAEHSESVNSVSFSPDGQMIASGHGGKGDVRLWDVDTQTLIHTFTGHTSQVNSVIFSPDGKTLASSSSDGTILLWDLTRFVLALEIPVDINGDGTVNIQDLVSVAGRIGQPVPADGDPADVNGDGVINILDLVKIAGALGN